MSSLGEGGLLVSASLPWDDDGVPFPCRRARLRTCSACARCVRAASRIRRLRFAIPARAARCLSRPSRDSRKGEGLPGSDTMSRPSLRPGLAGQPAPALALALSPPALPAGGSACAANPQARTKGSIHLPQAGLMRFSSAIGRERSHARLFQPAFRRYGPKLKSLHDLPIRTVDNRLFYSSSGR